MPGPLRLLLPLPGTQIDLAAKPLRAEDAIAHELRLVHRAGVEVEPHRSARREQLRDDGDALLEPRQVRLERRPGVVVGDGPARARARDDARAEALLHLERRIEIREVGAARRDVRAELARVGAHEQVSREFLVFASVGTPASAGASGSIGSTSDWTSSRVVGSVDTVPTRRPLAIHGRTGPVGSQPAATSSGSQAMRTWT